MKIKTEQLQTHRYTENGLVVTRAEGVAVWRKMVKGSQLYGTGWQLDL